MWNPTLLCTQTTFAQRIYVIDAIYAEMIMYILRNNKDKQRCDAREYGNEQFYPT